MMRCCRTQHGGGRPTFLNASETVAFFFHTPRVELCDANAILRKTFRPLCANRQPSNRLTTPSTTAMLMPEARVRCALRA